MDIQEIYDRMKGFDSKKETFDLWLEVLYLKKILGTVLGCLENQQFNVNFAESFFKDCRDKARKELEEKFPDLGIKFEDI